MLRVYFHTFLKCPASRAGPCDLQKVAHCAVVFAVRFRRRDLQPDRYLGSNSSGYVASSSCDASQSLQSVFVFMHREHIASQHDSHSRSSSFVGLPHLSQGRSVISPPLCPTPRAVSTSFCCVFYIDLPGTLY